MLGIGLELLSTARYVGTAVTDIGHYITQLLPIMDPRVRKLLECVAARVDAISQPLNFCLLWSHEKGSCISNTTYQARQLLSIIEKYVQHCALLMKQHKKLDDTDIMITTLTEYLRELDFAVSSVNLSLNIVMTVQKVNRPPELKSILKKDGDTIDESFCGYSLSALLRASGRINDVLQSSSGGDLTCSSGALYRLHADQSQWQELFPNALLKVYRNSSRKLFELHVDEVAMTSIDSESKQQSKSSSLERTSFDINESLGFGISSVKNVNEDTFGWTEMIVNQVRNVYAFVVKVPVSESSFLPATPQLRPIDIVYTVKLCGYENLVTSRSSSTTGVPFHLLASDEEIMELLANPIHTPPSVDSGDLSFDTQHFT